MSDPRRSSPIDAVALGQGLLHELGNATFAMTSSLEGAADELGFDLEHPSLRGVREGRGWIEALLRDYTALTGPMPLALASDDLCHVLRAALDAIAALGHPPASIDVVEGARVRCDRAKLEGALETLLIGAGATLGPYRAALRSAGAEAHVTLRGPGLRGAPARLFEPFAQRSPSGSRLAFAVARRVIEAHGGSVTAAADAGVRIDLVLPVEPTPR